MKRLSVSFTIANSEHIILNTSLRIINVYYTSVYIYDDNIYLLLYKKVYNDNKHFSLYETMYNDNIYLSLYKRVYNDNKHFYYIRENIMTTNISVIKENIFRIIRDDV